MAIAPTGDIFKSLEFDGEPSKSYGVYITGKAVYNAPEKDVEMISIPGRNGSFALDKGRLENIDVKYPAGIFATNEGDFATAVSDFRNYLCSKKGYCRLTDDYNPDEFRLAIYKSGLEVEPTQLKVGQFEITFDCKPQRYLMIGESAIEITSGETILNPTLFDAKPMLEVEGYGDIQINDATITIENVPVGETLLTNGATESVAAPTSICVVKLPTTGYETGDSIYTKSLNGFWKTNCVVSSKSGYEGSCTTQQRYAFPTLVAGTPVDRHYSSIITQFNVRDILTSTVYVVRISEEVYFNYDGVDTISCSHVVALSGDGKDYVTLASNNASIQSVFVNSTTPALGHPTYIDLDLGEAYMISDDEAVSLNNAVALPASLPELAPGANEVTYDNTITDLKIVPRWWKV